MKKFLSVFLTLIILCAGTPVFTLAAGGESCTLTYISQGKYYYSAEVKSGGTALLPDAPGEYPLVFAGWYLDEALTLPFDETEPLYADKTLYAGYYLNIFNRGAKDYSAYISYATHVLSSVGGANYTSDVQNRTAVVDVEPNTEYVVNLHMQNRFRVGFLSEAAAVKVNNYTADALDVNSDGAVAQTRSLTVSSGENDRLMVIYYYSKSGESDFLALRSSIEVYSKSSVTHGSEYAVDGTKWSQINISAALPDGSGVYSTDGCQWPTALEIDRTDGNLMFFGTNAGGAFRSVDGGKNWTPVNTGNNSHGASNFAIDPYNENHVLCLGISGTQNSSHGIYLSDDMGDSWHKKLTLRIGGDTYVEDGMEFDPSSYSSEYGECRIAYLSTPRYNDTNSGLTDETAGLYKTSDGGETWLRINAELYDGIVKTDKNGVLYVSNPTGLYMSADKGESFSLIAEGCVTGLDVFEFDGVVRIYYNDSTGVYLSLNGGADFECISGSTYPAGDNKAGLIAVSPLNPDNMAINYHYDPANYNTNRICYSNDGGKTWFDYLVDYSGAIFSIKTSMSARRQWIVWSPVDENKAFSFGGDFLITSDDAGANWHWEGYGISNIMLGGLFSFNVYNSDIMYFGAQDYGGAVTADGGKTWRVVRTTHDDGGINVYGGYAASENIMYGGLADGWYGARHIMITYDAGATIDVTDVPLDTSIQFGFESSYQSPVNPDVFFCGNMRSGDAGLTWSDMTESGCLQVYAHDGSGNLYGVSKRSGYLLVSADDGLSWNRINKTEIPVGEDNYTHILDVAVDEINGYAYVTAQRELLYKISLADGSVSELTDRIPEDSYGARQLRTVCVDPSNPDVIYAGGRADWYSSTASVTRSVDGGMHWEIVTPNTYNTAVTGGQSEGFETSCLRVNPQTGELWSGSLCYGFAKLNAPYENSGITPETVNVSFNDGEKTLYVKTLKSGQTVSEPLYPFREGFAFCGWYCDAALTRLYDFSGFVTEDITLYAKWSRGVSAVFYSDNKVYKNICLAAGEKLTLPDEPELKDYIFTGWYADKELSEKFDFEQPLTKSVCIYAGFCKNEFMWSMQDIIGYIRAADNVLSATRRAGGNFDMFSNRIALCRLRANTEYTVSMLMDTRFRYGLINQYQTGMVIDNCVRLPDDKNNSESLGEIRTVTVMTDDEDVWLALFFWAKGGEIDCRTVRKSIQIYDASKLYTAAAAENECAHMYENGVSCENSERHVLYCANACGSFMTESCFGGTASCTAAPVCTVCGNAYGVVLGHVYENGRCVRCTSIDPDYSEDTDTELTFFEKIAAFFRRIIEFFKGLFA